MLRAIAAAKKKDVMRVAATAGAGGYPGADDPVQKYADLPIGAEGKQAVIRAQSALYLLPESADVSLNNRPCIHGIHANGQLAGLDLALRGCKIETYGLDTVLLAEHRCLVVPSFLVVPSYY